jgi:hypothetical protein
VAVTVAGLGSSSTSGSIDELRTGDLGYDADRVVRFSYAGGRTPGTGAGIAGIDAIPETDYGSADTQGDIEAAARRLADLLAQVLTAEPDATVDVYAHSLGGLVARLALDELVARGIDVRRLGVVATLGSPVRGADLATAIAAIGQAPAGRVLLDGAESVLDTGLDPGAPVVRQLAEPSAVVARIDAAVPPPGVDLVSIAARGDLVAASPSTELAGARNVTVPVSGLSAHGDLVGSDAATGELARALAGVPPGCEGWADAAADVLTGHAIAAAEDALGAGAYVAGP